MHNHLQIALPDGDFRDDAKLTTAASNALAGNVTGVVLCARPGIGAVTLALLFGLYNLITGTWTFAQGIELRHTGKALHSVPFPP